ncbi:hypothetical protein OIE13_17050 [Streptosporangium sp. NBC_01810]|uniref:hypothetical protein n=1 Tax=Streptosporangium sp. NBC_01810 TaxID=2975951 RepID=UPI002DD88247|nr:hypothetical protein [Streptosporangium sp. NBC_01810]WSA29435.1 hypothetical protein OIE13_17050 [Streptosporangium sp. NBC_01810]
MQIDAGDTAAWISIIVALAFSTIALVVSLVSLKYQRESAKATQRAVGEAARSADASEASAEAGARSAVASERSAAAAEQVADIEADRNMRPTVSWELSKSAGHGYLLTNAGTETATGVTVDNSSGTITNVPENVAVEAGASVEFVMEGSLATRIPHQILVTWDGAAGPATVRVPIR